MQIRATNKENYTHANYTGFESDTFEENLKSKYYLLQGVFTSDGVSAAKSETETKTEI